MSILHWIKPFLPRSPTPGQFVSPVSMKRKVEVLSVGSICSRWFTDLKMTCRWCDKCFSLRQELACPFAH